MTVDKHLLNMDDIVLGEALPWDIYDGKEILLLRKGQTIASQRQLETLIERGAFIDDNEYSMFSRIKSDPKIPVNDAPQEQKEIRSALRLINQAVVQLEQILHSMQNQPGEINASAGILDIVNKIMEAIEIDPDITLACIPFKPKVESYSARHGVHSAILSLMTAHSMQKQQDEITTITCAALSMNVGMLSLQEQLQNKSGELSPEETALIKQHPQTSVELLQQAGITDEAWLSYVLHHHENLDGSGYPFGKTGNDIPENAVLISLADSYTALISPRAYRPGIFPSIVMSTLLKERKLWLDPLMAAHFIRTLGVHPPGAMVKLHSGETAVVSKRGQNKAQTIVHALLTQRNDPLPYPHKRETNNERYGIREPIQVKNEGIPFTMQQIWGKEASL